MFSLFKYFKDFFQKSEFIEFGILNSDSWEKTKIFKLDKQNLYCDDRDVFWQDRFTKKGYIFIGDKLPHKSFEIAKQVLEKFPNNLKNENLPSINRPGNKDEYTYYFKISIENKLSIGQINLYDIRDNHLKIKYQDYLNLVKQIILAIK